MPPRLRTRNHGPYTAPIGPTGALHRRRTTTMAPPFEMIDTTTGAPAGRMSSMERAHRELAAAHDPGGRFVVVDRETRAVVAWSTAAAVHPAGRVVSVGRRGKITRETTD